MSEDATEHDIPVIPLKDAPGQREMWGKPAWIVYLWTLVEWLFVTNALQPSSRLRVAVLRAFGAEIGEGVVFRPRTRVKYPWKLRVGDDTWIGEGVWVHNQAQVDMGANVVVSQETLITTGSHAVRTDMGLIAKKIDIADGAWLTSRCIVLGGSVIGQSSVVRPGTCIRGVVPPNTIIGPPHSPSLRFQEPRA